MVDPFLVTMSGDPLPEDEGEVWQEPSSFWDSFEASNRRNRRVGANGIREETTRAALWARHREVERRLGKKLPQSETMRGEPSVERDPVKRMMERIIPADRISAGLLGSPGVVTDDEYEVEIDKLRAAHPGVLADVERRDQISARLGEQWFDLSRQAEEGWNSPAGIAGALSGEVVGEASDPRNWPGAALGAPAALKGLAARILTQAAAGAGVEALQAPGRMEDARNFGGPEYGVKEAALDVGFGAGAGVGFEVLSAGGRAALRRLGAQLADDPAARKAVSILERVDLDDLAIGAHHDGPTYEAGTAALERGDLMPPRLEPDRDLGELFPEGQVAAGSLQAMDYKGRTIHAGRFDPRALEVDAETFQFKAGGNADGVTARLRGVEVWDQTAAGQIIVWENRQGARFIADGHQRRGFAIRMFEEKGWDGDLPGYLLRERDGWSAQDARATAALKNLREGSGGILDAAKVFRDIPEAIDDRSLPVTGDLISHARSLARLHPDAFRAVANEVIPERFAVEIGNFAPLRSDLHLGMVHLLKAGEPANIDEAQALVQGALEADWIKREGDQLDIFGYAPEVSTMIGRAKVKAAAKRALAKDARLLNQLVKHADAIETNGNILARTVNEQRLAIDSAALEVIGKLALRSGPVGEAMAEAGARVTRGEATPVKAAGPVLKLIREMLEAGERLDADTAARINPRPPSALELEMAEAFSDPYGPAARAQAQPKPEDAALEAGEEGPPGLWDDLPDPSRYRRALEALRPCAPPG